jgi:hypothetical protein
MPCTAQAYGTSSGRDCVLGDDFSVGAFTLGNFMNGAAKRLGAGEREGHAPEINLSGEKFNANLGFTIPFALDRRYARFRFAGAAFVHQENDLPNDERMFGFNLRAVLTDGVGLYMNAKFGIVLILPVQGERDC